LKTLVSGVAGLSASSSSKVNTLNNFDVKPAGCDATVAAYFRVAITETINTLFIVVNFLKCVVTEVV